MTRILVGIIGIPAVLACVVAGGWPLVVMVSVISIGMVYELSNILKSHGWIVSKTLNIFLSTILILSITYSNFAPFVIYLSAILILLVSSIRVESKHAWMRFAGSIASISYVAIGLLSLLLLYSTSVKIESLATESASIPNLLSWGESGVGSAILILTFAAIWICDSFAYFGGRSLGKHKLIERISPNKTWEGAISGLIGSIIGTHLLYSALFPEGHLIHGIAIGTAAGTMGQLGDLFESQLKRGAGIKDSSRIIPGHGGLLDRFDSLLFVAPTILIYFTSWFLMQ